MEYLWPYILLIMIPVVLKLFMKVKEDGDQEDEREERNKQTNKCNEVPVPTVPASDLNIEDHSIEYYRAHCFDNAEMYQKYFYNSSVIDAQQNMRALLETEQHKITKLLMTRKPDKAMEAIDEALNYSDPIRDANARHWFLISALRDFYSIRDFDPIIYSLCLTICDYDLSNIENWFRVTDTRVEYQKDSKGRCLFDKKAELIYHRNPPPNLETAYKKAIILEKIGDIDGAISFCEYAIENDLPDTDGKSFLSRKERLERKKAKLQKST